MISVVRWIGRGRLAERPMQYEMAEDEMEALVAKQEAMQLDVDGKHNGDDIGKQFDDSDDTDDEEDEMAGMERMGKHITMHAAEGEGEETADAANGHAAEDGEDEAMDDDDIEQQQNGDSEAAPAADEADDPTATALLEELAMDEYDNEPDGAELFLGGRRLTVHDSNADDPYITVADDDDDDSDEDDTTIRPTDCVLCVGRTEDEHSAVEVYVYDEDRGSLFVHHDFQIPSFPLAFTHLNQGPAVGGADGKEAVGSYLAVGTFLPGIEVWNLNVLDVLEPVCTLGGHEDERVNVGSSRKSKARKLKEGSHEDAVLCLDWHAAHRERLVSGSADETVKLWDVTTQQCTATLTHHRDSRNSSAGKPGKKDKSGKKKGKKSNSDAAGDDESWYEEAQHANLSHKVQSLHINPSEPSLLLTGSYDRTVHLVDMRTAGNGQSTTAAQRVYRVEADVEMVRWHGRAPLFLVATESGLVYLFDARKGEQPLFRLAAHSSATTAAQFNPHIDGLFLTSSADKTVKLWSVDGGSGGGSEGVVPSLLASKEMRVGDVWSAGWDVDAAALLACGGDKGKLAVWDIRENVDVVRKYGKQLGEQAVDTESSQQPASNGTPERKDEDVEEDVADAGNERKAGVNKGKREKVPKTSRKKSERATERGDD